MTHFIIIFNVIICTLASKEFFLLAEAMACIAGIAVGYSLISSYRQKQIIEKQHNLAFYFIIIVIGSTIIENCAWILRLSDELGYISINPIYIHIFTLIAWVFTFARYQSLGLFIENLIENKFTFRWYQKIFFIINMICIPILVHTGLSYIYHQTSIFNLATMLQILPFYFIASIIPSIIISYLKLHYENIPAILKKQLTIFLKYIIFPHILFDILQCIPFYGPQGAQANTAGIIGALSLIFITIAIIFCSLHLIRFRIFNFSNKVEDQSHNFLPGEFKNSIEQVSFATTPQELVFITQNFFKTNFNIPIDHVCLNFRYKQEVCASGIDNYCSITNNTIESFINSNDQSIELLRQYRILVADEIMFDVYYSTDTKQQTLAYFLENIDSQIFMPMYDKNNIIAYLNIKRSNKHTFYSHTEQNSIVIFGTYLASAINIMQNSNTAHILQENKKLKEDLYLKHQEINQYKESIKSLLKQKSHHTIGILFYKDNRFTLGNQTAQNIVLINLNQQRNHPTTLAITKLAEQVASYRTTQSCFLYDHNHQQIMITGVPHLDYQGGVIITMHYSDSADMIKTHLDTLQDPSQIDYLLYLETTKSGKLINQILPGHSESLLHIKIKLLELALHKKAILLESQTDDLLDIVEIIHHISLRHTLHILDLKPTLSTHDLSVKIFGINPSLLQAPEEGLLKKLDRTGTLFIKNVELLDLETQNKLAEFIRYGIFTLCKSEQRCTSDVRIICSTSQNAQTLVDQNKLSIKLFQELAQTTVSLPSLLDMNEPDVQALLEGFALQAIQSSNFSHLLHISKQEKAHLIDHRPTSLREFKSMIQHVIMQKSKDNHILHETHIDPECNITNPTLLKAANLGKHALKDSVLMTMLWNHFRCQNQIAQFLGVNRSSVQRRCKEYNLL